LCNCLLRVLALRDAQGQHPGGGAATAPARERWPVAALSGKTNRESGSRQVS